MKAIIPADFLLSPEKLLTAVEQGLDAAAEGALADFGVTVQTWKTPVNFDVKKAKFSRIIGTDSQIYEWVDGGTKPHPIRPVRASVLAFKTGGRPKSRVEKIVSRKGAPGKNQVFAKAVQHPGTEPRKFGETIQKKWEEQLPDILQRAIDAAAQ